MAGKAIVIKGLDFSSLNLGLITKISKTLVESIIISGSTTGVVGSFILLSKTVLPSIATNSLVSWSSSNTNIATVTSNGLVSILSAGDFTITAIANDGSGILDTIDMLGTIVYLTDINITNKPSIITNSTRLYVSYIPSNTLLTEVTWSSSNTNIATVNSNGVVSVLMDGNVTITVTSMNNSEILDSFSTNCYNVPVVLVNLITVTGNLSVYVGSNNQLSVAVLPLLATDLSVSWSSSNTNIATVNNNGVMTALTAGNVTITAVANDGSNTTGSLVITTQAILISGIGISGVNSGTVGGTIQLGTSILPLNATNQNVIWNSSDTNIITVNSTGFVSMIAAGTATVTATSVDGSGVSGTLLITSNAVLVSSISLAGASTGFVGGVLQLSTNILPSNATNKVLNWTTSDENIATVSNTGFVNYIGEGSVIITATSTDGSNIHTDKTIIVSVSTEILDKTIISFTAPVGTTAPVYATNGSDVVNLIYPLWGVTGVDVNIKNISGTVIGKFKRNTSEYPADVPGVVIYKTAFNYKSPIEAEVPTGLYPFALIKSHYLPSNANTSYVKAITRFSFPNGVYTVKLLSCTNSTSYTPEIEAKCFYLVNDVEGVAMTYNPLNNNSVYTVISNIVVTDGIIDIKWYSTGNYMYLPGLNLVEIIKNV